MDINVYFKKNKIYNLEDMSVLKTYPLDNLKILYKTLKLFQQSYNIKIAIMGLDHPLRNTVYCVFPKAIIIISPEDVSKMIDHFLGEDQEFKEGEDEIAATVEGQDLAQGIYMKQSKSEAINYYRQWQGNVPLGIHCFQNIITTIDYYYEEVFNYFEFQTICHNKARNVDIFCPMY